MTVAWNSTVESAIHAWVVAGSGLAASQVIWAGQNGPRPAAPMIEMRCLVVGKSSQDWLDTDDNYIAIDDDVVESVDAGTNRLTLTAHDYGTGDGPVRLTTTGTAPGGLAIATDYWTIDDGANVIRLATTHARAVLGTAVDVTDAGTGTHTIVDTATTTRHGAEVVHRVRGPRLARLQLQCFGAAVGATSPQAILEGVLAAPKLPTVSAGLRVAKVGVGSADGPRWIGGDLGGVIFEPRGLAEIRLHLAGEITETGSYFEFVEIENQLTSETVFVPQDPSA